VVFDTTPLANVHADARIEYVRRHPDLAYDVAFSKRLVQLRKKLPRVLIYTNQGYRSPENYLPYVDADLTESLITRPAAGTWEVRPWNDPSDPWNSISFLMRTVIEPLELRYPRVHFLHLNYAGVRGNDGLIPLVFAIAKLFGGEGYVASDVSANERDEIYFREFGKPRAARVELANGDGAALYGSFAQVQFQLAADARPLAIPASILKMTRQGPTVAVVAGDNRVHFQTIELGRDHGATIEVLSGLNGGEALVINPAESLTEGATVEMIGSTTKELASKEIRASARCLRNRHRR